MHRSGLLDETQIGITPLVTEPDLRELLPPPRVGRWEIERLLDRGGHGVVFAASDPIAGRAAAVKVLHGELLRQPGMVERFLREVRIFERIRHENIVEILDAGCLDDGRPYYAMELLHGRSLRAALELHGRFSPRRALEILEPLCAALDAAHRHGVVHRDVKAGNVFLLDGAGAPGVKLLDFGIAKLSDPEPGALTVTRAGQRIGSAPTMSPEQIRGEPVDARTDVYAVGVLAFQLLTGRYPFISEDPIELERMHLESPPPRPGSLAPVPPGADAVVLRCLQKRPDRRFGGVAGFLQAFRDAVGRAVVQAEARTPVVAMFLDVEPRDESIDTLACVAGLLDEAEEMLRRSGFAISSSRGDSLVAARVLRDASSRNGEEERARRLAARARALAAEYGDSVHVRVSVRIGEAIVRGAGQELELLAGDIFDAPAEKRLPVVG